MKRKLIFSLFLLAAIAPINAGRSGGGSGKSADGGGISYSSSKSYSSSSKPQTSTSSSGSSKSNNSAEKTNSTTKETASPITRSNSWLPAFLAGGIIGGWLGSRNHESASTSSDQTENTQNMPSPINTPRAPEITPAMITRCLQIKQGSYTFAAEENVEKETHDCTSLIAQYQLQLEQNKQTANQKKATDHVLVH